MRCAMVSGAERFCGIATGIFRDFEINFYLKAEGELDFIVVHFLERWHLCYTISDCNFFVGIYYTRIID